MNVKKIQIKRESLIQNKFINIPLDTTFETVDRFDLIKKDFIEIETKKSINPILDYEKVRLTPKINNQLFNKVIFNLNLLNNGLLSPTNLDDAGFTQEEINFNKNSFKRSFLRLSFYDSDKLTSQRLMSFYTIYLKVLPEFISPNTGSLAGLPIGIDSIPLMFRVKNPLIYLDDYSEGFNLYHYKDEIPNILTKSMYMRFTFNNAKSGTSTGLMTVNTAQNIDDLVKKIHIKYDLFKDETGFYYSIDTSYSDNIQLNGDEITINLYEILSN